MTEKNISKLEKTIGVTFIHPALLQQAMVHRSYLNENPTFELDHNERLEFLGDAVLELVVTEYLYQQYDNPEGELTNWRAALVNAKMLGDIAQELNFNNFLYLSKGESKDNNTKARQYILANAVEAVIGAIYLDKGYDAAQSFIQSAVISHLPRILKEKLYIDPKTRFQEAAQEHIGVTPSYQVLHEEGPDHSKTFRVGVFLGDEMIAEGTGSSKQEAQVAAAEKGIEVKGW
ncbi:MAG: ribonuclease III [Candidatus Jacksonbacteria bacterium RIFCSPLOWO2_02_FULL_43_9]|nr:MAG: Ribonuclease 3 [Parcubacteria group bacterium GW2011_GWA2_43_13]OGY69851.1 MAG: ribonuclease III [Candidatus Jacksonbacteria bacterium RIFCSPHIGHO2_02_FULL_43_10]OGY71156.1 MAG: ribonuclease III [Candidatus Jacksonbacteria bacterium RIFCSPLOWO2_01_FULL_44_13]OGY73377.1 MAG: ribonuclease III [Candidatus Jacksonbacteria bacterium RIFCSPLOWO2_02_FULL_43_9]HAZ16754.1 ribonuclease III [Candidatus Jacksonbacteria bacterium]